MAKKTMFDMLYGVGAEAIKLLKKPGQERMLKRAAERVADELESKKIEADSCRTDLEHHFANAENEDQAIRIAKEYASIVREIEEAEELVGIVKGLKNKLFEPKEMI